MGWPTVNEWCVWFKKSNCHVVRRQSKLNLYDGIMISNIILSHTNYTSLCVFEFCVHQGSFCLHVEFPLWKMAALFIVFFRFFRWGRKPAVDRLCLGIPRGEVRHFHATCSTHDVILKWKRGQFLAFVLIPSCRYSHYLKSLIVITVSLIKYFFKPKEMISERLLLIYESTSTATTAAITATTAATAVVSHAVPTM